MVGTDVDGQLSATATRSRSAVHFALATPADEAAIRRLLRENPMRGTVTLTLEREPDYFLGANIAGASDRVIVAYEHGQLLCMGRCTTRDAWLNGAVRRVGYLAELRLDARGRARFDVLRGGYRFFAQLHRANPADFYFTSIAADNTRARRLLERGLPGFPRYEHLADLTTVLVSTHSSRHATATIDRATATELTDFLHLAGARHHLATAWTSTGVDSLSTHDLDPDSFHVIRENQKIVAAGALWDQRRFRQTVVRGYSRLLHLARPLINTLGGTFGLPPLPAAGTALSHAFLSPLAIAAEHDSALFDLVAAISQRAAARNIAYLTLALPSDDPRLAALQRRHHCRTYASRLYRVRWSEEADFPLDHRPFLPDVALL